MSFRAPSLRKRRASNSPSKSQPSSSNQPSAEQPSSHQLIEHHLLPKQRRAYGTKGIVTYRREDLLVEPRQRTFTQPLFGPQRSDTWLQHAESDVADDPFAVQSSSTLNVHFLSESLNSPRVLSRQKRERQSAKWVIEVIPAMLQPYFRHLYETQSLRHPPLAGPNSLDSCPRGTEPTTSLSVTCVYFNRMC